MKRTQEFKPSHTPLDFSHYETEWEVARIRIIEELLPPGQGKQALDIGSGNGFFSKLLSSKSWKVTAIDTDESNLESAKEYAVHTHLGDAVDVLTDLPSSRYDFATALEIIEHMPKTRGEMLLQKILRVLKKNGKLLLSTPNRHSPEGLGGYYWSEKIRGKKWNAWDDTHVHNYTSSEILQLLKSCGFAIDRMTGYYYGGRLPVIHDFRLPLTKSAKFPLNRLGFDIIVECHKK
jgi:2-polyprenyl-3-methyl-5-hydroxy-6-metoxy-1,4-benzoquinol methylase